MLKYVVVLLCIAGLAFNFYMITRTPEELDEMGVNTRGENE